MCTGNNLHQIHELTYVIELVNAHSHLWKFDLWWIVCREFVVVAVQLPSRLQLFATPWTVARQASLSLPVSWSLLKFTSIDQWCDPAISSSDAFFFCPQSFPASETFSMSQLFASNDQNTGVSTSASVLPMNIQGWFPLGLIGMISLQTMYE